MLTSAPLPDCRSDVTYAAPRLLLLLPAGFFRLWTETDPFAPSYTGTSPLLVDFKDYWNTNMGVGAPHRQQPASQLASSQAATSAWA